MATPTLFESCTANLDSTSADYVTNILQCVAAGTDTLNSDLSAGINTFYLIYGGALVL